MRLIGTSILVLLIAGAAFAQGQQQPRIPQGFSAEEWQQYGTYQQELQKAFQYKEYEKGVEILPKCIAILEKGLARVKSGEAKIEDEEQKKNHLMQLERAMAGDYYNLCCCQSMTDDKAAALKSLEKSVELGWLDVDHMKVDSDLDPIRKEPGFKAILEKLNYNDTMEFLVPEGLPAEGRHALVVALHWTNGNEAEFMERFKSVAAGAKAIMAFPRGPITLAAEKYGWKRHSDDEDAAIKKIKATIDAAKAKHAVDDSKIYLMGVGNGGYFASLVALKFPGLVAGAIPINSFWNRFYFSEVNEGEDSFAKAKEVGTRFCFIQGKEDSFFSKAQGAVKKLVESEVKAKLIEFDGGRKLPDNIADLVKQALGWMTD